MDLGGGVLAMVYPIHAPIAIIAMNANSTGVAMTQKRTFAAEPKFMIERMYGSQNKSNPIKANAIIKQAAMINAPND